MTDVTSARGDAEIKGSAQFGPLRALPPLPGGRCDPSRAHLVRSLSVAASIVHSFTPLGCAPDALSAPRHARPLPQQPAARKPASILR